MGQTNVPLGEMISAVIDGESSEFEMRRVLDGCDDAQTRALMARHFAVRSVLRGEATALCPARTSAAIFAALDAEASFEPVHAPKRWRVPFGGIAVAASVCMLAVFSLRTLAPATTDTVGVPALAASGAQPLAPLGPSAMVVGVVPATAVPVGFDATQRITHEATLAGDANRLAEDRLHLFMGEHVRNAAFNVNQGMLPYARVVSDESR